jgi:hypothetical protein
MIRADNIERFAPFPFVPDNAEAEQMGVWRNIIQSDSDGRIERTLQTWEAERTKIGKATGTLPYMGMKNPKEHLPFLSFDLSDNYRGINLSKQSLLDAPLLLAARFKLRPELALTAWIMEGLETYQDVETLLSFQDEENLLNFPEKRKEGYPLWISITQKYCKYSNCKDEDKVRPHNEDEARRYARSIVLFERWGLDVLTPCTQSYNKIRGDNFLLIKPAEEHDKMFDKGLKEFPYSMPSPLDWFNDASGPIKVRKQPNGDWAYCTERIYQPVVLWLLTRKIADSYGYVRKIQVPGASLDPPFDALLYLFHNGFNPMNKVRVIVNNVRKYGLPKIRPSTKLDGRMLYNLFVKTPVPSGEIKIVVNGLKQNRLLNQSKYINALRFEFIRQACAVLFEGIPGSSSISGTPAEGETQ